MRTGHPRGQRNHEVENVNTGIPSKVYSFRSGICNAAQTMGESAEQARSWRGPMHRVPKIMVDTSREGGSGKGLYDKDQPGSIRRGDTLARGANTGPMAGAAKVSERGRGLAAHHQKKVYGRQQSRSPRRE